MAATGDEAADFLPTPDSRPLDGDGNELPLDVAPPAADCPACPIGAGEAALLLLPDDGVLLNMGIDGAVTIVVSESVVLRLTDAPAVSLMFVAKLRCGLTQNFGSLLMEPKIT